MGAHDSADAAGGDARPRTDQAFWDAQWSDRASRSLAYRVLHGRDHGPDGAFLRTLRTHVGARHLRGASIVELGGAVSRGLLDLALHEQARATVVDYSEVGLRQTEAMFAAAGAEVRTIQADFFAWDTRGLTFDLVTHWGVLEHFEDPAPLLELSARLLRPGGLLVFSMPNLLARGAGLWARWAPDNFSHHVRHEDAALDAAFRSAGLTLERRFFSGPPLVRMSPWERRGLGPLLANVAHVASCGASTLFPGAFVSASGRWARLRGFVARREH